MNGHLPAALVDALAADADALDHLARLLAPRLATPTTTSRLTVEQAAQAASVSGRTIRRALTAGLLDGRQVAGRWQTTTAAVNAWQADGGPTVAGTAARRAGTRPRAPKATRATNGADAILAAGGMDT